jgi:hypothetical protein
MLHSHTTTQMIAIALDRKVPNSSSLRLSGVGADSVEAKASWIFPMADDVPVPVTRQRALQISSSAVCFCRSAVVRELTADKTLLNHIGSNTIHGHREDITMHH